MDGKKCIYYDTSKKLCNIKKRNKCNRYDDGQCKDDGYPPAKIAARQYKVQNDGPNYYPRSMAEHARMKAWRKWNGQ